MTKFAKKSLSLVLALLMAISMLTISSFSAFAADTRTYIDYTANAVSAYSETSNATWYNFTPSVTGTYYIKGDVAKIDATKATPYDTVSVFEIDEDTQEINNYAFCSASSSTKDLYSLVDGTLTQTEDVVVPAFTTVKLTAGEQYKVKVVNYENTTTTLNIAQTDFRGFLGFDYAELTFTKSVQKSEDGTDTYTTTYTTPITINDEDEDYPTSIVFYVTGYCGTATTVAVPAQLFGVNVTYVSLENTKQVMKNRITSVTLPEGVKEIGSDAFEDFYALTSVNIPSTVEYIGSYAFTNTAISGRVIIPEKCETVGYRAFYNTKLASAEVKNAEATIGEEAFGYAEVLNEATADPTDTTSAKVDGFFVVAPAAALATTYATNNGFTAYDPANCTAGNHPYAVTPATLFAKGSKVCPVCGNKVTLAKKTFKIKSLKSAKKAQLTVKANKQADIAGYEIKLSTTKKFTKKTTTTVTVETTKALNKTVKKLNAGKKYFVKVRAYKMDGTKKVYSQYTATKSVKVKKK